MIIKTAELETVVGVTTKNLPKNLLPEIAFAGRSNVGKSSLINTLVNRKALARTSGTPGKTQTMNYYKINSDCYLVDLPGYGYSKTDPGLRRSWGKMIERYLRESDKLRSIFLLVDIRHKPTADDCEMFGWIRTAGFQPVVIATKLDKLKRSEVSKAVRTVREVLGMKEEERLIPFSSVTRAGREEILELMDTLFEE